jgi:5-methylcytosine-specific restriction endonuclease McrA
MPILRLTSSGELVPADAPRRPRPRRLDSNRRFRASYAWHRLSAQVIAEEECCALCGSSADPTVDHIVPLSRGGSRHDRENLRRLCRSCNSRLGARLGKRGAIL